MGSEKYGQDQVWIEDEKDGMVRNTENKKTEEIGKEDRREDNCGEEQMQCKTYT